MRVKQPVSFENSLFLHKYNKNPSLSRRIVVLKAGLEFAEGRFTAYSLVLPSPRKCRSCWDSVISARVWLYSGISPLG